MAENDLKIAIQIAGAQQAAAEAQKVAQGLGAVGTAAKESSAAGVAAGGQIGGGLGIAAAGAAAAALAVGVLRKALDEFAESETVIASLNAALKDMGEAGTGASEAIQEAASAAQGRTLISDEDWTRAATALLKFNVAASDIPALIPTLEGLAGVTGSATSAAELYGRVMAGNTRGLNAYGIKLDEHATKQDRLNALHDLAARGQSQLAAQLDTLSGSWAHLKLSIGDLAETLGGSVANGLHFKDVINGIADAMDGKWWGEGEAERKRLATSLRDIKPAGDDAAAGIKAAAESADEIKARMDKAATAATNLRSALDALADEDLQQTLATIDEHEANGDLSKGDAQRERAKARFNNSQAKNQRQIDEATNTIAGIEGERAKAQGNLKPGDIWESVPGADGKLSPSGEAALARVKEFEKVNEELNEKQLAAQRTLDLAKAKSHTTDLKFSAEKVKANKDEAEQKSESQKKEQDEEGNNFRSNFEGATNEGWRQSQAQQKAATTAATKEGNKDKKDDRKRDKEVGGFMMTLPKWQRESPSIRKEAERIADEVGEDGDVGAALDKGFRRRRNGAVSKKGGGSDSGSNDGETKSALEDYKNKNAQLKGHLESASKSTAELLTSGQELEKNMAGVAALYKRLAAQTGNINSKLAR